MGMTAASPRKRGGSIGNSPGRNGTQIGGAFAQSQQQPPPNLGRRRGSPWPTPWNIRWRRLALHVRSTRPLALLGLLVGLASVTYLAAARRLSPAGEVGAKVDKRGIADMRSMGYPPRPRSFGHYFLENGEVRGSQRLFTYWERYPSKREMRMTEREIEARDLLKNSKHYRHGRADKFETSECKAQYPWQTTSFPTCNALHERDLSDLRARRRGGERVRLVAHGYWRDVWMVREFAGGQRALKTIRYEHDYEERNYDRHRRDALAMERLSGSDHVVNIYAYCGNSGIFEYSTGGDIDDVVWPDGNGEKLTKLERLRIAVDVSIGIADMHNVDKEGVPSIAHTDITPGQFILIDGIYKLNDFNRARFIRWNPTENRACKYRVGNNPGKFRAPEEYEYEDQSEKIDIYSMGNVFYVLLTELWPFDHVKEKAAQRRIMDGKRPPIKDELLESTDPIDVALIKAMEMCWVQDPEKRTPAREVSRFLSAELKKLDPSAK